MQNLSPSTTQNWHIFNTPYVVICRLIYGFCSKEGAESLLRPVHAPTMLIRFSDMLIGHLKLSCKLPDNRGQLSDVLYPTNGGAHW